MYERLKMIRAERKMNQSEFSKALGIGQSTLAMMEVGKREITDRHIKTICAIFGVNEKWLRHGIGDMFIETEETIISSLATEYDLDSLDRKIIECYINMQAPQRMAIKSYLRSLFDTMLDDDTYSDYRDQYINENAGQAAARDGNSENLGEIKELFDNK